MTKRLRRGNLQVSEILTNFIENEALADTNISPEMFWEKLETILDQFVPRNKELLQIRSEMKSKIDKFYLENSGKDVDHDEYVNFLKKINYIVPEGEKFQIKTKNVDDELALKAGPQLVVPVTNARYALNAANARWGSLYDALYGTDAISENDNAERSTSYNPTRGKKVITFAKEFLDKNFPLQNCSHKDVISYKIEDNSLLVDILNGSFSHLKNKSFCFLNVKNYHLKYQLKESYLLFYKKLHLYVNNFVMENFYLKILLQKLLLFFLLWGYKRLTSQRCHFLK